MGFLCNVKTDKRTYKRYTILNVTVTLKVTLDREYLHLE
jgi:hypothetical protein